MPFSFSASKTRAMVYVAYACGYACGGGKHYLVEQRQGRWQTANLKISYCSWIA
jgi:hypothetical protein